MMGFIERSGLSIPTYEAPFTSPDVLRVFTEKRGLVARELLENGNGSMPVGEIRYYDDRLGLWYVRCLTAGGLETEVVTKDPEGGSVEFGILAEGQVGKSSVFQKLLIRNPDTVRSFGISTLAFSDFKLGVQYRVQGVSAQPNEWWKAEESIQASGDNSRILTGSYRVRVPGFARTTNGK